MIMARNEDGTYSQVGFVKDNGGIDTEYIYDKDEYHPNNSTSDEVGGVIKFGDNGSSLEASAVTDCDKFEFHPYESSNEYKEVTKFTLGKQQEITEKFSKISFCKYFVIF